jgi:exopolysaccharide production protein ExoQ
LEEQESTMRRWNVEEVWSTGLLICIAMGGYVPVLMAGLSEAGSRFQMDSSAFSSPVSRIVILFLLLGILAVAAKSFSRLAKNAFSLAPLAPYIAVAILSLAWSQDVNLSLRRLVSFLLTCLFGMYFAVRFTTRSQIRMMLTATSLLAVGSILLVAIAPQYALDHTQHAGAWQGVFAGKNACAMVMVVGLMSALVYRPTSVGSRVGKLASIAMFLVVIAMAQSSGAVLQIAVLAMLFPLLRHLSRYEMRTRSFICAVLVIGVCVGAFFLVQFLPDILRALNRDPTLTGRTQIWADVMNSISKRPLLGYGYGAFWAGLSGESTHIVLALKWNIPNAHDGYLDIWLSLGALGLAAFGVGLAQALRRVWQVVLSKDLQSNMWLVMSVLLVLLYNIDESVLISAPSLMWTLFVSSVCGLELYARRHASIVRLERAALAGERIEWIGSLKPSSL